MLKNHKKVQDRQQHKRRLQHKGAPMEFELSYRSEENHIFIPEWENRDMTTTPDFYYTMEETRDKYYYELEIGATWDDKFGEIIVRKVGIPSDGKEENEWMEELTEEEVQNIIKHIGEVCFNA